MAFHLGDVSIVIADQSRFMRRLLQEMLTGFGVGKITTVENGQEALKKFDEIDIDMVICDNMMDPIDGYELTRTIRNNPDLPNRYLPIIFLTGHADMHSVLKARDAGATEFLVKPVAPAVLYERVAYVIEHQRPFIQAGQYFGPDRRRRVAAEFGGVEKRGIPNAVDSKGLGLTQEEVEAIFKGRG
jgi:two-component system, chemotaxis family, chemotaxis protein CheY